MSLPVIVHKFVVALRKFTTAICDGARRVLFGPASVLVPGRGSKDALYVRPLVFRSKDVLDAANLMVALHKEQYADIADEDLQPQFICWSKGSGIEPSSEQFDFENLPNLSGEQKQTLMASAFGAIIEFGNATPATIYFGNDLSKTRVEAAYALLLNRGRYRMQPNRLLRLGLISILVVATAIVTIIDFLSGIGTSGVWATAFIVVGVIAIVVAILEFLKSPHHHLPHIMKS